MIEGRDDEIDVIVGRALLQLQVFVQIEFEIVAVFAVGGAVTVLVVVGLVVHGLGEQRLVVALLELDRVDAHAGGHLDHVQSRLQLALVIVTDLGDHITRPFLRHHTVVNRKCFHHPSPRRSCIPLPTLFQSVPSQRRRWGTASTL